MEHVLGQIDLSALILACLPMSKHKLSLQLVSKTWKMALETPAAHSLKTDDSELPFAGHGMSKRVTQVLSQCKCGSWGVEKDQMCDQWLGPSLQRLNLDIPEAFLPIKLFESLPVMPRLNQLDIFAWNVKELYQYDLSQKFPSLKTLFWGTKDGEAPSHLERLTELTRFEFYMSETTYEYNPHRARGWCSAEEVRSYIVDPGRAITASSWIDQSNYEYGFYHQCACGVLARACMG